MSLGAKVSLNEGAVVRHQSLNYWELASLPDEGVMARLQQGHHDALAVLFDRYRRLVMNVALRILRDPGEAEDLLQSVFLEIFRSVSQFDSAKGSVKIWILQYVYHRGFNRRQYLNLRGIYDSPERSGAAHGNPVTDHRGSMSVMESERAVKQALERLNKTQRKTLELAFYEGLTMHEIAERTGESFSSVRHHYYRGLEKLRATLCAAPDCHLTSSSEERVPHAQS